MSLTNRDSTNELIDTESEVLRLAQASCFKDELSRPKDKNGNISVSSTSSIAKLDPIMVDGLIRVGGRLQRAQIDSDTCHPVILPKNHRIVDLITKFYHHVSGHSGLEYTLTLIREKFWIIKARSTVRKVLNGCVTCRKCQAPAVEQKMASLPSDRTTPGKPPFSFTGVDCFGLFEVRHGRTRAKRYGVIFTCMTTRAIHIEIANSLDTESFINALRRFIARRGQPGEMRSDNGGNFVKGEKELRQEIKKWNEARISLVQRSVKWTFNPPRRLTPWGGGFWSKLSGFGIQFSLI